MNVAFTGGTDRERDLVRTAMNSLLNLDLGLNSLDVEFQWVDDPSAAGHNDLAATSYGTTGGVIQLRKNLDTYKGYPASFYIETVAHEIGHLLTHFLAPSAQAKVAALFQTTVDGILAWEPGTPWEDRTIEGVAETFKDAFLPRRLRYFANRTNVKLSISKYDQFRRIFREGQTGGGGRFCYVYGSSDFRVTDEWDIELPLHFSPDDADAFVKYQTSPVLAGSGVAMNQFEESGTMMFSIRPDTGGAT